MYVYSISYRGTTIVKIVPFSDLITKHQRSSNSSLQQQHLLRTVLERYTSSFIVRRSVLNLLSSDSSFYYTCAQGMCDWTCVIPLVIYNVYYLDFKLRVYDTAAPLEYETLRNPTPRRGHGYDPQWDVDHRSVMKIRNSIQGSEGSWTIPDSHLSPDNERLVNVLPSDSWFRLTDVIYRMIYVNMVGSYFFRIKFSAHSL